MNLKLTRPLCVFDLETTGTNVTKDRIVEICVLKVMPDGSRESKTWLVNPEMPISQESSSVHGITNEDVKDAPTFKMIAPKVMEMLSGSDLGGFNSNRFDVPLLVEELLRAGIDFDMSKFRLIDAQVIYHKMEPRNLTAAYRYYCDKNLEGAHSAEADTLATFEVLDAQVGKYEEVPNDIAELSEFSYHQKNADFAGFIAFNDNGEEIFTFGKHKGRLVTDVLKQEASYYSWMQNADFPLYTKKVLTGIYLKMKF